MIKTIMVCVWAALNLYAANSAEIVAAVICAEARGEGNAGMCAVYEVICERARIKGVTTSKAVGPKKFSCLNRVSPDELIKKMKTTPQWGTALKLASSPPKTTYSNGATHFTRSTESPYWARNKKPVAVIGAHSFYRLPF